MLWAIVGTKGLLKPKHLLASFPATFSVIKHFMLHCIFWKVDFDSIGPFQNLFRTLNIGMTLFAALVAATNIKVIPIIQPLWLSGLRWQYEGPKKKFHLK